MPGFVIHLCIAKEYIRKHKNIENENEFFDGAIYPDTLNKSESHYSPGLSNDTNLYKFLLNQKIDTSFNKGWFLHLLSDCLFYKKYFTECGKISSELLYNDYDVINKPLKEKYELSYVPKEAEYFFNIEKEGKTVYYHYDKVVDFIDIVSNFDLDKLAEEILLKKDYKFLIS